MPPVRNIGCLILLTALLSAPAWAQEEEDQACMDCHDDRSLFKEQDGLRVSLHVEYGLFARSAHGEEGCISCHQDVDVDDLPHEDELERVDCSMCHDEAVETFEESVHGQALRRGASLAPRCATCHSKHNVLPASDARSWTHLSNVPSLCGSCHKEGLSVSALRPLSRRDRDALPAYPETIHREGVARRGLTVTPVCTSCHSAHDVLPAHDPASAVHRSRVAETCMTCHGEIEKIHVKTPGEASWKQRLSQGPTCVDCHRPHRERPEERPEARAFSDAYCLSCHVDEALHKPEDGTSLYVDATDYARSVHGELACVACHTNVSTKHDPVCLDSGPVACATCHLETVATFQESTHGQRYAAADPIAPRCSDCHGTHDMLPSSDVNAPTFARNIPDLCGKCHREGQKAAVAYTGTEHEIVKHYTMSIHGKGLLASGLVVTATCVDCHTAHHELPASDPTSTVHPDNIAGTCAQCHVGIYEIFKQSVHSPTVTQTDQKLPSCNDCHQSHTVSRVSEDTFRQSILDQCGNCHEEVTEKYFETFHGKVSKLGSLRAARCYDCHGSHNILPASEPASLLSADNVVDTCKKCHPGANVRFAGYLTHADHHDRQRYPYLYYAFWAMTILLVSVFTFFGVHTLLWFPRALAERRKKHRADGDD